MLLNELFEVNNDQYQNVDWISDLKFYIDNNDKLLQQFILPAVAQQRKHSSENSYKLYMRPLVKCMLAYAQEFKLDNISDKIPHDDLEKLARQIASEQAQHIENRDYD